MNKEAEQPGGAPPVDEGEQATRPVRSVAGATMLSRVLGLVRDKITVFVFPEAAASALVLAWTIPNLFRRLFGEGALAAALIPAMARAEEQGGAARRDGLASAVITGLVAVLSPLTLLLMALLWWGPRDGIVASFESAEIGRRTLDLLLWMLPYLVLVCVGAQLQGLANLAGRFFVPAFAPAVVNVLWIGGAVAAAALATDQPAAEWVAGAVLIAGGIQVAVQVAELRRVGVDLRPRSFVDPEVAAVARQALPMVVGLAASQVNLLVDRLVAEAWVPGDGAIRHLYLSNRLMQLPLGLVGVALGTAAYPVLARAAARREDGALGEALARGLRFAAVLSIPALFGLGVLASPILVLLFEGGEFSRADVDASADCLLAYAPTLLFQAAVLLLARTDYARGRQRRVVRVGLVAVAVNVVLDFVLVGPMGAAGVAAATSVASVLNAVLLGFGIAIVGFDWRRRVLAPCVPLLLASLVMAAVVLGLRRGIESTAMPEWWRWGALGWSLPVQAAVVVAGGIAVGASVYFLLARRLAPRELEEVRSVLGRRRRAS